MAEATIIPYKRGTGGRMTREKVICIAEEFSEWLEDMVEKYGCNKDDIHTLIRRFLQTEGSDKE